MAENKKSFILYCDLIHTVKKLPDDKAGILFKHLLSYVNDENPTTDDLLVEVAFEPIKRQLKRDLEKFEEVKIKRSEAGKLGGRPKNQTKAKKANALFEKQTKAKKADTDNDTDNDNVTVNDNDISSIILSEIKISDVPIEEIEFYKIALAFNQLFEKNISEAGGTLKHIKSAKYKQWVNPIRLLMVSDGITKEKLTLVFKFLQNDEFWKKNIQSTETLRKQINKLILAANEKPRNNNGKGLSKEYLANLFG